MTPTAAIIILVAGILGTSFVLWIRAAQKARADIYVVGTVNYIVGTLFFGVWVLASGRAFSPGTVRISLLTGLLFVPAYCVIPVLMSMRGVSIANAVLRLSVVIPVCAGLAIWGERLTPYQVAGVACALASLPLLAMARSSDSDHGTIERPWLVAFGFLVTGIIGANIKWWNALGHTGEKAHFYFIVFAVAAVGVGIISWRKASRWSPKAVALGAALGLTNSLSGVFILMSLDRVGASIFYPLAGALSLIFVILFGRIVWAERLGLGALAGIVLTLAAIVLASSG